MQGTTIVGRNAPREILLRVGGQIRHYRVKHRLNQHELARLAGVSRSRLSDYELGKVDIPITQLWKIARALGMTVSELLQTRDEERL